MSKYVLYVGYDATEHAVKGRSPAKALRELVAAAQSMTEAASFGR